MKKKKVQKNNKFKMTKLKKKINNYILKYKIKNALKDFRN